MKQSVLIDQIRTDVIFVNGKQQMAIWQSRREGAKIARKPGRDAGKTGEKDKMQKRTLDIYFPPLDIPGAKCYLNFSTREE